MIDYPALLFQAGSILVTVVGAVWYLSAKLASVKGQISNHSVMVTERFRQVDKELERMYQGFKELDEESRKARVEIWSEVNSMRERLATAEAKIQ